MKSNFRTTKKSCKMKKAKCISKTEKHVYFWSHYFTIGKVYDIILNDETDLETIYLRGNDGQFFWVTKESFKIIDE